MGLSSSFLKGKRYLMLTSHFNMIPLTCKTNWLNYYLMLTLDRLDHIILIAFNKKKKAVSSAHQLKKLKKLLNRLAVSYDPSLQELISTQGKLQWYFKRSLHIFVNPGKQLKFPTLFSL